MNTKHIFWKKVKIRGPDECWNWKGYVGEKGYGNYGQKSPRGAHIIAFLFSGGKLTAKKPKVLHSCNNKLCCNPKHLRAGSVKDNSQDALERGQQPRGEKVGNSKLKEFQVSAIRKRFADGEAIGDLAKEFDVVNFTITKIVNRVIWKHI